MVTAEKIAERVGVCRQTVSSVMNGNYRKVSAETRRAILSAAEELGYVPDLNAKALSGRSIKTIGLIIPILSYSIGNSLIQMINMNITRRGYKCYLISPSTPDEEEMAIRDFISRKFDGLIVCCKLFKPLDFERWEIPVVVYGAGFESSEITADLHFGMSLALDHLHSCHHHRDIVFLTDRIAGNQAKYDAYCEYVRAYGLPEREPLLTGERSVTPERIRRLLDSGVTAFAATGDILAGNLLNILAREGIRVPQDVAVTGYDALLLSVSGASQLSAVVHPVEAITRRCVDLLFDKIAGHAPRRLPEMERIKPFFFKGQTCGCNGITGELHHSAVFPDLLARDPAYADRFVFNMQPRGGCPPLRQ